MNTHGNRWWETYTSLNIQENELSTIGVVNKPNDILPDRKTLVNVATGTEYSMQDELTPMSHGASRDCHHDAPFLQYGCMTNSYLVLPVA